MDLHLSLDADGPITQQIFQQLRDAILTGRLVAGDPLPSSRDLATSLGVSRNTVSAALDHLRAEGYVRGRPGVGTFVGSDVQPVNRERRIPAVVVPREPWQDTSWDVPDPATGDFSVDFRPGLPDVSSFPFSTWRRLVSDAIRRTSENGKYGDPQGVPELRHSIARHLAASRGVAVGPDAVVVTNGVQQAISLLARILLAPGDVVAVEDPGYPPVRRTLQAAGAHVVGVPVDNDGLVVQQLPHDAGIVCVTPAHQFPLGVRMSLARRTALLEWAREHRAVVIEDDYDTDFRFSGRPIDPLHSLDISGRVIYVGSFSKTMFPSLRLGYCVVPPGLIPGIRRARFIDDWHGPTGLQKALAGFIDEGRLASYVRRMRRLYQSRRDRIAAIIDTELSDVLVRIPSAAGLHMAAWARADDADVAGWAAHAASRGVGLPTLEHYAVQGTRPGLVLGFGAVTEPDVVVGLRALRRAVDQGA